LKNLVQHETCLEKKLFLYERLYSQLSPDNYDFNRKLSWLISKTYYKKSVMSQNSQDLEGALAEIIKSRDYYDLYTKFTLKITEN